MYPPNVAQTRLKLVKARFGISEGSWLCSGCSYILVFSFCLYFASFPAGGQVLDEILLGSLAHFLRLRGGNSESSTARKSLIVNLAALAGKTGHTSRDHVRRVFLRWTSKTQHQGGSGEVLRGQMSEVESKVGTLAEEIFLYLLKAPFGFPIS